jgi:hypothetical protein
MAVSRASYGDGPGKSGEDMTKIKDLHKTWMKDAAYRRECDALEEEFTVMAAIAKARRSQPGRTCAPDEDHAEHRRAARKRTRPTLDAHAAAVRKSDGTPAQDQFSTDEGEGVTLPATCSIAKDGFLCVPMHF